MGLARILSNLGRDQEALPHATEAVKLFRAVEEAEPGSVSSSFAFTLMQLARILSNLGRDQEALPHATKAESCSGQSRKPSPAATGRTSLMPSAASAPYLGASVPWRAALTITREAVKEDPEHLPKLIPRHIISGLP